MKNLFIITILYLLLSMSQAWALPPCEGDESNWQNCEGSITSQSGKVYIGVFKDGIFKGRHDETGGEFEGEYKDGSMHGQATFTLTKGKWKGYKYVGEWKDGKYNGQGTVTYPNGEKYVGEWKDNKHHGQGTVTYANGRKYVGEWKDGKYHGQGTFTFSDGRKYVGEWKDNQFHGQGTFTFSDGRKYVGEWKDNQYHGQGTFTFADGKVWEGQWRNDEWVSGKQYAAGEYNPSSQDDVGRSTCPGSPKVYKAGELPDWNNCTGTLTWDGGSATGKFINGDLPYATLTFDSGEKYVGEFKNEKYHGQGTLTYTNGDQYVGEWKNGKMHGQGTLTYADGAKKVGEWENGYCEQAQGCTKIASPKQQSSDAGRLAREKKSKEIEQANDNIRIALDALNYTFGGNKKERTIIVLDAEKCIFEKDTWNIAGKQYDKFYLNNVIVDTIKFHSKRYYNEAYQEWMDAILISFSGDEPVFYHGAFQSESNEYEGVVSDSAELERVRKAWGVIYSRACKGASAGEF